MLRCSASMSENGWKEDFGRRTSVDSLKTKLIKICSSPRFTVFLLIYGTILVFLSTIEQSSIGIAAVQDRYIDSFICLYPAEPLFGFIKIPLFGGAAVGLAAMVNILASGFRYVKTNVRGFWFCAVHLSIALLIASGFIQYFTRVQGNMVIAQGTATDIVNLSDPRDTFRKTLRLPFKIKLEQFDIDLWPGSSIAKGYSSKIAIINGPSEQHFTVKMNSPVSFGGWTFYQSSYMHDGKTTVLSAVRNPAKILPWFSVGVAFIGMAVMFSVKFLGGKRREK